MNRIAMNRIATRRISIALAVSARGLLGASCLAMLSACAASRPSESAAQQATAVTPEALARLGYESPEPTFAGDAIVQLGAGDPLGHAVHQRSRALRAAENEAVAAVPVD